MVLVSLRLAKRLEMEFEPDFFMECHQKLFMDFNPISKGLNLRLAKKLITSHFG